MAAILSGKAKLIDARTRARAQQGTSEDPARRPVTGAFPAKVEKVMPKADFAPVTPGEMLKEEFLAEYGLSQTALAKAIGISPNRIAEIVNNRRRITADTALRLGLYFGNSPEFWMNLQAHYDQNAAGGKTE